MTVIFDLDFILCKRIPTVSSLSPQRINKAETNFYSLEINDSILME